MTEPTITKREAVVRNPPRQVAILAVLIALLTISLTAVNSENAAASTRCRVGEIKALGTTRTTNATFTQRLDYERCYGNRTGTGRIHVHPLPGYQPSHILGCRLHVLYAGNDHNVDCTAQARLNGPWELEVPGWSDAYSCPYVLLGWVNIQSFGGYYNTERFRSIVSCA